MLHAQRGGVHLVMGSSCGFTRRSVGYVGASDGWQDLVNDFKMDWEFRVAEQGNIALTGEIEPPASGEFTVAIACGGSYQSTVAKLLQSLADPFETHRQGYVRQWQRAVVNPKFDFSEHTCDGGQYVSAEPMRFADSRRQGFPGRHGRLDEHSLGRNQVGQ